MKAAQVLPIIVKRGDKPLSPKAKQVARKEQAIKTKLKVRGTTQPGDLINKAKRVLGIIGLI